MLDSLATGTLFVVSTPVQHLMQHAKEEKVLSQSYLPLTMSISALIGAPFTPE